MATHSSILASFVKNKVPIGAWVYFWAFYLVLVIYISVLGQYHTVLTEKAMATHSSTLAWKNLMGGGTW